METQLRGDSSVEPPGATTLSTLSLGLSDGLERPDLQVKTAHPEDKENADLGQGELVLQGLSWPFEGVAMLEVPGPKAPEDQGPHRKPQDGAPGLEALHSSGPLGLVTTPPQPKKHGKPQH